VAAGANKSRAAQHLAPIPVKSNAPAPAPAPVPAPAPAPAPTPTSVKVTPPSGEGGRLKSLANLIHEARDDAEGWQEIGGEKITGINKDEALMQKYRSDLEKLKSGLKNL